MSLIDQAQGQTIGLATMGLSVTAIVNDYAIPVVMLIGAIAGALLSIVLIYKAIVDIRIKQKKEAVDSVSRDLELARQQLELAIARRRADGLELRRDADKFAGE